MRCRVDGDPKGKDPRGMTRIWTPAKAGPFSSLDTSSSMAFNHDWLVDPRGDPVGRDRSVHPGGRGEMAGAILSRGSRGQQSSTGGQVGGPGQPSQVLLQLWLWMLNGHFPTLPAGTGGRACSTTLHVGISSTHSFIQ